MADTAMSDDEADILNELLGDKEEAAKVKTDAVTKTSQKSVPAKEKSPDAPAAEG
ncbi:MAG: hypothetical protein IPK83_17590 [Planctomycetes bacterium]|nr:hypothetical protein [Planctomycetota bacterium]